VTFERVRRLPTKVETSEGPFRSWSPGWRRPVVVASDGRASRPPRLIHWGSRSSQLFRGTGELGDMYADAAAVSEAVRAAGEPVILCGHSYGGTVITEAGAGAPNVRHLIYITSVLADLGQSHADAVGAGPAPWVHPQSDGTAVLRSEQLQGLFFQDCDDGTFAEALTRATPQSVVASSTQRADRPLAAAQVTRRWQPQLRDDGTGQVVRRPNRRAGWAGRPAG